MKTKGHSTKFVLTMSLNLRAQEDVAVPGGGAAAAVAGAELRGRIEGGNSIDLGHFLGCFLGHIWGLFGLFLSY